MEGGLVGKYVEGVGAVTGVTWKEDSAGWLAVIKCSGGGGPMVAFAGARTLKQCVTKVRNVLLGLAGKWRADQYAKFDKSSQSR